MRVAKGREGWAVWMRYALCSFWISVLCSSLDDFTPLILQEMSVGYANGIRVMSITHTGEPGFVLYIPIEVRVHCSLS